MEKLAHLRKSPGVGSQAVWLKKDENYTKTFH